MISGRTSINNIVCYDKLMRLPYQITVIICCMKNENNEIYVVCSFMCVSFAPTIFTINAHLDQMFKKGKVIT